MPTNSWRRDLIIMAKYNFYIEDVSVEAVFNKLGGVSGAKLLLADKLIVREPCPPLKPEKPRTGTSTNKGRRK
jgi:hypothetical protein